MDFDYKPKLTLSPDDDAPQAPEMKAVSEAEIRPVEQIHEHTMEKLSEAERAAVLDFAKKIDLSDTNQIMQYGSSSQKNIADFSSAALENVCTKDLGEVGSMLSNLVVQLQGFNFDMEEKKGVFSLFKRATNKIETLKAQYNKAEVNVDKIIEALETHQVVLLKDMAMLDKMYELNQSYLKELSMYILAGKERLKEARKELPL